LNDAKDISIAKMNRYGPKNSQNPRDISKQKLGVCRIKIFTDYKKNPKPHLKINQIPAYLSTDQIKQPLTLLYMLQISSFFAQLRATTPQVQKSKGTTHFKQSLELLSIKGRITLSIDRRLPSTDNRGKYCVLKVLLYFPANQSIVFLNQCPLPSAFSYPPVSTALLLIFPLSTSLIVASDPSQNYALY